MTNTPDRNAEIRRSLSVLARSRLQKLIGILAADISLKGDLEASLQDAVHQAKGNEADVIDHGGLDSQIEFLSKFDHNALLEHLTSHVQEMEPGVVEAAFTQLRGGK